MHNSKLRMQLKIQLLAIVEAQYSSLVVGLLVCGSQYGDPDLFGSGVNEPRWFVY